MKTEIRIGAGNVNFDRVLLVIQGIIVITFLVLALLYENAVILFVLFSIGIAFECFRMFKRNYVTYQDSYFIVRGLFKERARIRADQFESLSSSRVSIPFSNELIVSFRNGQRFKMMGGASRREDIEKLIKDLIRS
jgi:hypothetical protein